MSWSAHRLRSSEQFRAVTRGGVRSARSHVVVHLGPLPEGDGQAPRVGFVVSKKIGNAVICNRVTRRLREIIRPLLDELPAGTGVVARALPGIDQQPFDQLREDVQGALASAERKLQRRTVGRRSPRAGTASRTGTAAEAPRPAAGSEATAGTGSGATPGTTPARKGSR
ncbi:ribonuclease P protein component [Brachybacterium sp. UMB0905]|uniref:ribonuclease P protein component n=1 Tax=Brachybacterium sp. UMB0905 TaxID=2069310 RepID=UPI0018EAE0E3|nr:ribonuclease P protein component [Brachybacterium sp. UMB0905]